VRHFCIHLPAANFNLAVFLYPSTSREFRSCGFFVSICQPRVSILRLFCIHLLAVSFDLAVFLWRPRLRGLVSLAGTRARVNSHATFQFAKVPAQAALGRFVSLQSARRCRVGARVRRCGPMPRAGALDKCRALLGGRRSRQWYGGSR
jgi:hypothetical protein